jgi:hypothetical protein
MLQGYTLTGRTGLFPSYEAFLGMSPFLLPDVSALTLVVGIIQTMMVQYSKFTKMVCSPFHYHFLELTVSRSRPRFHGANLADHSTTSRRPPGRVKNTMVSLTKIRA